MKQMNNFDFARIMDDLASVWPNMLKEVKRIDRIKSIARFLPVEAFEEIANELLDSSWKMPLPTDFDKLAKDWKHSFFQKNGFYYGFDGRQSEIENLCEYCFDCGVIKIKQHTGDFLQLMRCDCEKGKFSPAKLPAWDNELKSIYIKTAINPKWFNPNIISTDDLDKMNIKTKLKFDEWQEVIKKSEKHWSDLGYVHKNDLNEQ